MLALKYNLLSRSKQKYLNNVKKGYSLNAFLNASLDLSWGFVFFSQIKDKNNI